jgi:2-keto-3-deoxy-L-rhamnonate aldolase RhmA
MELSENKLRTLLDKGWPSVATRMWTTSSFFVEALGDTKNFDYVEFLAEYAPYTHYDLQNFCIAAELHGMSTMIKIDYQNNAFVAQKAVASGFQAINFTDCRTVVDVKEAIRVTMPETPQDGGSFGFPNNRFIGFQPKMPQQMHAERQRKIVRCFMIEKASAVEQIEEICSVPGVDMIQFGPSDYCMSRGWNAKDHIDDWKAAERHCIEVALKHKVNPRCEIQSVEAAQYYLDLGVKHICLGDQLVQLSTYWTQSGKQMQDALASSKK